MRAKFKGKLYTAECIPTTKIEKESGKVGNEVLRSCSGDGRSLPLLLPQQSTYEIIHHGERQNNRHACRQASARGRRTLVRVGLSKRALRRVLKKVRRGRGRETAKILLTALASSRFCL